MGPFSRRTAIASGALLAALAARLPGTAQEATPRGTDEAAERIVAVADVHAQAGREADLAAAIERLLARTRERDRPVLYEAMQDAADPAHFVLYEVWATQADLEAHLGTTIVAFLDESRSLIVGEYRTPADIPATVGRQLQPGGATA